MQRDIHPPPDSVAAVGEAARLAAGHHTNALQRRRSDGAIDVVVFEKGRLHVYTVGADGRSRLDEVHPRVWRHVWCRRSVLAGIAVFCVVAPAVYSFRPGLTEATFAVGLALAFGGAFFFGNTTVYDGLKAAGWNRDDWGYVPQVEGAAPGTRQQVEAALELARRHESHAFARRLPDKTTEVIATEDGRLYRYWIDVNGNAMLIERSGRRLRYSTAIAVGVVCLVLFVLVFVLGASGVREGAVLILFGVMFVSLILSSALANDTRADRIAQPRDEWLEITIPVESSD